MSSSSSNESHIANDTRSTLRGCSAACGATEDAEPSSASLLLLDGRPCCYADIVTGKLLGTGGFGTVHVVTSVGGSEAGQGPALCVKSVVYTGPGCPELSPGARGDALREAIRDDATKEL
jgi:hypothetical protein